MPCYGHFNYNKTNQAAYRLKSDKSSFILPTHQKYPYKPQQNGLLSIIYPAHNPTSPGQTEK
jgi:hypothetical protein